MTHVALIESEDELLELYEAWMKQGRSDRLRPRTLSTRETPILKLLLPWCRRVGITSIAQIDQDALTRFKLYLSEEYHFEWGKSGKPLSSHSVHSYLTVVNTFLKFAQERENLKVIVAKRPRLEPLDPEPVEDWEIERLREVAGDRERLMIEVLRHGLRCHELCMLRTSHVEMAGREPQLRVPQETKTGTRPVPISKKLYEQLQAYIRRRPRQSTDHLFLGTRRNRSSKLYEGLLPSSINHLFVDLTEMAHLSRRITPQMFRIYSINKALAAGIDPLTVAMIHGNSLEVIMRHYKKRQAAEAYRRFAEALS